ncbi:MAG: cobalt transporter CbiM [Methanobacteriaceae archaeon]|nr:cobalt transporter CbiM [Methanobacteriaceae archaeon]MDO9627476.1 cobalt transporter CbiM [Methanobacteriaceae archaeon]
MHIPDGFLPLGQAAIYYIITIIALYFALNWAKENLDEKRVPLMAVLAAFIFAIQAMNIPIPWGTSGHMLGAALVAIIFGSPWAAVLVLAVVLTVQTFFFADGGITAWGANILDMGVIAGFTGFGVFQALKKLNLWVAIFLAGWASIFVASLAVVLELVWAGTFPLDLGLFFMGLYHAVIGIAEGAITVVAILAIQRVRPDLLPWNKPKPDTEVEK